MKSIFYSLLFFYIFFYSSLLSFILLPPKQKIGARPWTRDGSDLVRAKGRKVRLKIHFLGKKFQYLGIISYLCTQKMCIMATKNENPVPFMAVHPGAMIKPELEERGISQKEFASMLGVQASHLSEVLNGKRALTTDLAVKIEKAIGLPAKILLSAQTQYDLESAHGPSDDVQRETVSLTIPVHDRNLLRELVRKFGWACVF